MNTMLVSNNLFKKSSKSQKIRCEICANYCKIVDGNYQDLLLGVVRGVATIDRAIRKAGVESVAGVDTYFVDVLFACITNANFDDASILKRVDKGIALKKQLLAIAKEHNVELPAYHEILWGGEKADYEAQSRKESVLRNENEDLRSLKELTVLGLKGMAAYYEHASRLG